MRHKNYLLLKTDGGYPFGVLAASELGTELHGPFYRREGAAAYIEALKAEYSDYTSFHVCKIEVPGA